MQPITSAVLALVPPHPLTHPTGRTTALFSIVALLVPVLLSAGRRNKRALPFDDVTIDRLAGVISLAVFAVSCAGLWLGSTPLLRSAFIGFTLSGLLSMLSHRRQVRRF